MFYINLGGTAGTLISASHNANYNLFSNIQDFTYWSGTEFTSDNSLAWDFLFNDGVQGGDLKLIPYYAWAVRPGDVAAAVPEPATALLFGVGAVGLGLNRWWGRRRR